MNKPKTETYTKSPTVVMIVRNSVLHDGRVMKEATSLADANYNVTVVGVQDKKHLETEINLTDNLKIIRAPWIAIITIGKIILKILTLILLLSIVVVIGLYFEWNSHNVIITSSIMIFLIVLTLIYLKHHPAMCSTVKYKSGRKHALQDYFLKFFTTPSFFYSKPIAIFLTDRKISRVVMDIKPEIIHCHDIFTIQLGIKLKHKLGCKLVYDAHEIYEETIGVDGFIQKTYCKIHASAQGHLDGFITINENIINYYKTHYPRFPEATLVMNAARQQENLNYDGRLHKKAGIPSEKKIVLYQGGFTIMRGIPMLIKAAASLSDEWTVVCMGWGKLEPQMNKQVEILNNTGSAQKLVIIPPAPQDELLLWTAGATIGVILYEPYGLNHQFCTPNKLWEYPAADVPVIASPRDVMKEMINQYRYGWVIDDNLTPEKFADFINSLSDEEIKLKKSKCHNFIEHSNWKVFEKNLLEMYNEYII